MCGPSTAAHPRFPEEGQRVYQLGPLSRPTSVPGRCRPAADEDRELLLGWTRSFESDTGAAFATAPVAGVSRVGLVYTPPEKRRHGYAAACVASVSQHVLEAGAKTCILYTQLHNATSNRLYRAIGYEAVAEVLAYRFDEASEIGSAR